LAATPRVGGLWRAVSPFRAFEKGAEPAPVNGFAAFGLIVVASLAPEKPAR